MKLNALLCEAEFLERTTWQLRPRMLCMVYPCRQLVAMKTEPDISGKANRHDKFDNWSCFVRRQWLSVDNDWGKWLLCTRQLPSCIKVISSVLGALCSLFTQHMQFCLIALTRSCKYSKTPFWAQWILSRVGKLLHVTWLRSQWFVCVFCLLWACWSRMAAPLSDRAGLASAGVW